MPVEPATSIRSHFTALADDLLAGDDPARLRRRNLLLDDIEQYPELDDLRDRIEAANVRIYDRIREQIRRGDGRDALSTWLEIDWRPDAKVDARDGYDHLDAILAGIVEFDEPAPTSVVPTPEMVFYQPTPARHIIDLLRQTALTSSDVLVDLGAGLGHVAIVTAICTGARTIGVELEPAYVACARRAAERLRLHSASFVESDARMARLDEGTVFFLYTPFSGAILRSVLEALHAQAMNRPIRICTYGPCTTAVAAERWLTAETPPQPGRVALFHSATSHR